MKTKTIRFLTALAIGCFLSVSASAAQLSVEVKAAAEKITSILIENGDLAVSIGAFSGVQSVGNFGPGLQEEFRMAFDSINLENKDDTNRQRITVNQTATMKIVGTYQVVDNPDDLGTPEEQRELSVKVSVVLRNGADEKDTHSFYLNRIRDIITAEGMTFSDPGSDSKNTHKKIRETRLRISKHQPTFTVDDKTKIKSEPRSPYSVELLTRSAIVPNGKYNPVNVSTADGIQAALPFVPIGVGQEYAVRVYNNSNEEVAVGLKVDGIDQFTFSENRDPADSSRPQFGSWIVGANSFVDIKGWHITTNQDRDDSVRAFLVTEYGKGLSQHIGTLDPAKNGVISVSIAKSHLPGSSNARSGAETGFGRPIKVKQTVVKRKIDPPHDFISVRYSRSGP